MQTQAIIFDFDGVLVESTDVKTSAFQSLYRSYGKEVIEQVTSYQLLHAGVSRYEKIRHYQRNILDKETPEPEVQELAQ